MERRIYGLENEYGITCTLRGQRRLSPDEVARYLFRRVVSWGRSSNVFLQNGARLYLDVGSHPEYATPECDSLYDLVVHDKAGERILEDLVVSAEQRLSEEGIRGTIYLFKNNTDSAGNSYGCHENYLTSRDDDLGHYAEVLIPFLVSRQIYTGAGKILQTARGPVYSIAQRAEHIWEGVSSATTRSRPIINTRDEPHADAKKYRRLHVIVGDANLSQVSTFLKIGPTALVLCLVEDDCLDRTFVLKDPVLAMRQVSYDLSLRRPLELDGGGSITALDMQWEYFRSAQRYAESRGLDCIGGEPVGREVLRRWEHVLTALESDPMQLADQLDWVAKYRLINGYRERHDLRWNDARMAAMDLQYHDMRPAKSLFSRLGVETLVDDADAAVAMSEPPEDTRAYFRGKCLQKWADDIVAANWDSMVFDIGDDPLRRVPMMEPTRGTKAHVGSLLAECETSAELLRRLGS